MADFDEMLARRLEGVEAAAYASILEAADTTAGAEVRWLGSAMLRIDRSPAGRLNRVNLLGVSEPATPEIVDSVLEVYRSAEVNRVAVDVGPLARPPELPAWLSQRGLAESDSAAKVYRAVQDRPAGQKIETDLRIEQASPATEADLAAALQEGFGMTPGRGAVVARSVHLPSWRWFVAYDGTLPVAAGGLYVQDGAGWLGYGATIPTHRKRGAQGAIIARRIAAAAELGCEWVTSETSEDKPDAPVSSFHNMLRNGMQLLYLRPTYEWRQAE
jgi:hypothetical protein